MAQPENTIASLKREVRSLQINEVRTEKGDHDETYLVGYAALFNSLSRPLGDKRNGTFRERIMPGAFAQAIAEKQDVRHLQNHDPNFVLGRTKAGTCTLSEDATGLKYRTLLPNTSYARDLAESVERGDVDGCSFGFIVPEDEANKPKNQSWVKEGGVDIRQLHNLSLLDISNVTYPAYFGTSVGIDMRAAFPDGMPAEVRSHLKPIKAAEDACECTCESCVGGDCENCSNTECDDPNCTDCPMQEGADDKAPLVPTASQTAAISLMKQRIGNAPKARIDAAVQLGTLELLVYGDIGDSWFSEGITASSIKAKIDTSVPYNDIRVRITSMGGDAFEAIAIHNLIRAIGKPIETCVDGLAASAASIIAMCGDKITMGPNSMMMVHNAQTAEYGFASDLRKTADVLDKVSASIAQTYVSRTGKDLAFVQGLMNAETWMSAEDCVRDGFATGISGDEPDEEVIAQVSGSFLAKAYRSLPERFNVEKRAAGDAERRAKQNEEANERERLNHRRRVSSVS